MNEAAKSLKQQQQELVPLTAQNVSSSIHQRGAVASSWKSRLVSDKAESSLVSHQCGTNWGLSNPDWPISPHAIQKAQETQPVSFIKKSSSEWKQMVGQLCEKTVGLTAGPESDDFTFCMKLGGCFETLSGEEKGHATAALQHFRNVVRSMKGVVSERLPLPILVLASESANIQPQVFLLVLPKFKPSDVMFWKCRMIVPPGAPRSESVNCPTSFSAELRPV